MADATGSVAKMGVKTVAGWDSSYATVDTLIPFTGETISSGFERLEDPSLVGVGSRPASGQGNENVEGDTTSILDYYNHGSLIKASFGAEAGGVYTIPNDQLLQYRFFEFDKDVERWRYGAAKIRKILIRGSGQWVEVVYTWIVKTRERSGTAFPSLSQTGTTRVRFRDLRFRVADLADAIAAGDEMGISSFEWEMERPLAQDYDSKDPGTQLLEPIPSDFRTTRLKITVPRFNSTTKYLVDWKDADTPLQADLYFSQASKSILLELPNMRAEDGFDVNVTGPDPLRVEGTFGCYPSESSNPMYVGNEARLTLV